MEAFSAAAWQWHRQAQLRQISAGRGLRGVVCGRMVAAVAKGFDENKNRVAELNSFGKELARRARSKCELCEQSGVALKIFEVAPVPKFPEIEKCAFLCETCAQQMSEPRKFEPGEHWRCAAKTVWSEVPAVQVLALRVLRRQPDSEAWARETLDSVYVDPEVDEWAAGEA